MLPSFKVRAIPLRADEPNNVEIVDVVNVALSG